MGKDFKVYIDFTGENKMSVRIDDLTPVGTAIKQVLIQHMDNMIRTIQKEKEDEYGRNERSTTVPNTADTASPGTST